MGHVVAIRRTDGSGPPAVSAEPAVVGQRRLERASSTTGAYQLISGVEHVSFLPVSAAPGSPDALERPHAVWWILVIGGLTVLALQGFSAPFYSWWVSHVNPLPGQRVMRWVLFGCAPIHVYEALYVYATAEKLGMP